MNAIEATGLRKEYGNVVAVDGVDLSVDRGAVFAFLGPNGAGKTTTMAILTGLTPPTAGRATVAGADVTDRDALRERIGYLPEEPPLFEEVTAYEQLDYVAGLRGLDDDARERADRLLSELGLAGDADERIDGYSNGMRQKAAFVQAAMHDPDVLFLDEPTSGLDPRAARTLRDTIADMADGGTTVFLSTHILPVAEELADVVGVLYDGRIVAEAPPGELVARTRDGAGGSLEDAFLELTEADPADGSGADGRAADGVATDG
jgi:ABC-2 type transport system ATP-binding protein